ncbi:MAG: hypothetical protein AAFP98_12385, partial [Pseudomonadota bacterium]
EVYAPLITGTAGASPYLAGLIVAMLMLVSLWGTWCTGLTWAQAMKGEDHEQELETGDPLPSSVPKRPGRRCLGGV